MKKEQFIEGILTLYVKKKKKHGKVVKVDFILIYKYNFNARIIVVLNRKFIP